MDRIVYLASRSPRRNELLGLTGIKFELLSIPGLDEDTLVKDYSGEVIGQARFLAEEKAGLALQSGRTGIFITADTIVVSDDGVVLGKPADEEQAAMFLDRLSGNWHTVATGVTLAENTTSGNKIESILESTRVKFSNMSPVEIRQYISTGEPFDKAGGYGIQGRASIYIEGIEGCYFNVVGFPLHAFWEMWKSFIREIE